MDVDIALTRDELRKLKNLIIKADQLIAVRDAKILLDEAQQLINSKLHRNG